MQPLYKFISTPEVATSILSGNIKFTPIPELNDPAELRPTMRHDEVIASLEHMRTHGYSDDDMRYLRQQSALLGLLAPTFQAIDVPNTKEEATRIVRSPFYDSIDVLEELLTDTAREIASKVGVFCVTNRIDSLPMWAHYAANAAGFVVEYSDLDSIFKGDDTGVLYNVRPVDYHGEVSGVTFDPRSHENLFFSKYQDWSYEREFRVVVPLSDCTQRNDKTNTQYFNSIPSKCITRLILGWNMMAENLSAIKGQVRDSRPWVQVLHAHFTRGRIELCEEPD